MTMIPVLHEGHIAFYLRHPVMDDTILNASVLVKPDGSAFHDDDGTDQDGDLIICYTCHHGFDWQTAIRATCR